MVRRVVAGVVVVATTLAGAATALGQDRGARFTVGGGAGVTTPFHGDFDFQAIGWEVAGRGRAATHLTIEAFASTWRHSTETRRMDLPLEGPGGPIGTVGQLTLRSTDQNSAFGASLLPTFAAGRATFVVGGGANVIFFQHRFEQQLENCQGVSAETCGTFSTSRNGSDLGTHAVAGIDVGIASRLIAFGQYRIVVPVSDPGSGHAAALAGLRLALR
jgi:hypothetical protein